MSKHIFGGDPRRFTYLIRLMTDHIYNNFYHKISGDSMWQWIPYIQDFRYAIWYHIQHLVTTEETNAVCRYVSLNIPFNTFCIFDFLDDTGFRTTAPGRELR